MRRLLLLLSLTAATTGAQAESAPARGWSAPSRSFALAINEPFLWKYSVAASGWAGWSDHHAIRLNVARYRSPLESVLGALTAEDAILNNIDFGHTTDVGIGWVYFPRQLFDGAALEAGALCRIRRTRDRISDDNVADEERYTRTYGARVLASWTMRFDSFFIALAVGASLGYERGREKRFIGYDPEPVTLDAHVSRADLAAEGYLRFGAAFGH